MTTITDIKKILSKGLTGQEAGRLILQDNWEVDHGREGFLSDKDIQTDADGVRTLFERCHRATEQLGRIVDALAL